MKNDNKHAMRTAIDLVTHSLYKPDSELRLEAKDSGCYNELMVVQQKTLEFLNKLRKTYKP